MGEDEESLDIVDSSEEFIRRAAPLKEQLDEIVNDANNIKLLRRHSDLRILASPDATLRLSRSEQQELRKALIDFFSLRIGRSHAKAKLLKRKL